MTDHHTPNPRPCYIKNVWRCFRWLVIVVITLLFLIRVRIWASITLCIRHAHNVLWMANVDGMPTTRCNSNVIFRSSSSVNDTRKQNAERESRTIKCICSFQLWIIKTSQLCACVCVCVSYRPSPANQHLLHRKHTHARERQNTNNKMKHRHEQKCKRRSGIYRITKK